MNVKPIRLKVYFNKKQYESILVINQYNRYVPYIVEVFDADGTPYEFTDKDIIKLEIAIGNTAIIKSTGFAVDGNKVAWQLDREIALNSGTGSLNFVIEGEDGSRISSYKIPVTVESSSINESTTQPEITILLIEDLQELITKASTIYNDANLSNYVKKENGKGLSTNDFNNTYKSMLDNMKSDMLDYFFPVGRQIVTRSQNDNPNAKYPGTTWVLVDGYIAGYKQGDSDFGTVGAKIGTKTHTHDGSSLKALIGAVNDNVNSIGYKRVGVGADSGYNMAIEGSAITSISNSNHATAVSGNTGSSSSLPPTTIRYIWERTA